MRDAAATDTSGLFDTRELSAVLHAMHGRHSSNSTDKVCAIAFPFKKRVFMNGYIKLPIYDPNTSIPAYWEQLISSLASVEVDNPDPYVKEYAPVRVSQSSTVQLLRLFPHPSRYHWFPSWAQVQQYPDVSVRDNDSVLAAAGLDYSLHIKSGRIYQGCSLQLTQPPAPNKKEIYCCTMDGKDALLAATVPGIELRIDLGRRYVLVDISPDHSLWVKSIYRCMETSMGHEHLPIWPKSVILVCEEVEQSIADTVRVTEGSSATMRYCLRRVTTLEWDCELSEKPGSGHWLPFEPSLVHIRYIICSTYGGYRCVWDYDLSFGSPGPDPNVFCDPVAVAGLMNQEGWDEELHKRWPVYSVYLI